MKRISTHPCLLFFGMLILVSPIIYAQDSTKFLDAEQSDPIKLGWMVGSPPPADRILRFEDGSFFQFPGLRWSVAHMRQFMPTVNVSRVLDDAKPLLKNIINEIDQIKFTHWEPVSL